MEVELITVADKDDSDCCNAFTKSVQTPAFANIIAAKNMPRINHNPFKKINIIYCEYTKVKRTSKFDEPDSLPNTPAAEAHRPDKTA